MRIEIELSHDELRTAVSEYLASRGHAMQITEVTHNFDAERLVLQIVGEPMPPKPKVVTRGTDETPDVPRARDPRFR